MVDNKEYLAFDDFSEFESVNPQNIGVERSYLTPTITTIPVYRCSNDDIQSYSQNNNNHNNNNNNIAFIKSSNKFTISNEEDVQSDDELFAEFGFDPNHCDILCHDTKFHQNTDQYMFDDKNIDIDRIIHGYFIINSDYFVHHRFVASNIISNIITLCRLFCCILDKFDIKTSPINTQIINNKLNGNIAIIKKSGFVFNHNTIKLKGRYRWSFKVTFSERSLRTSITFSLQQNGKCIACHSLYPGRTDKPHPLNDILTIYFDADPDHQCITFKNDANHTFFKTEMVNRLNGDDECRLCIFVRFGSATIQMVRYQSQQNYNSNINIISRCDDDREERVRKWMMDNIKSNKISSSSEGIDGWTIIPSNDRISKRSLPQRVLDGLSSRYNYLSAFGYFGRHC